MDETGIKLLKLMFKDGETICVHPDKFGYHSIPIENAFSGEVTLVPPNPKQRIKKVNSSELLFVALNPIKGFRNDASCTAYRNFLIEMDFGPLAEQLSYIKRIGMPYSACVFSGNKSLHFLISLEEDLPSENVYRLFSEWILNITTAADQSTKNPSRSIRIPGAIRDTGKQRLVELKGKVRLKELVEWLNNFPVAKPVKKERKKFNEGDFDPDRLSKWVLDRLNYGLEPNKGRNQQWFAIGCEFCLAGYTLDDTINLLSEYYVEENDFKRREWENAIKSGFRYIRDKNG